MALVAGCPRCSMPLSDEGEGWVCPDHGEIVPLWRPEISSYESFAEHLLRCGSLPTLLPWPMSPGWGVTDFGCVAGPRDVPHASFTSCAGPSDLDGVVELTVVSEEPGVGLGARCAGVHRTDPAVDMAEGPPPVKVRLDGHPVPLWPVSTSDSDPAFDRSVFVGEAHGRWLWLVLRPASAALLLKDEWSLVDVADRGPELVDVPFGGHPPAW